ncbi:amino acid-binding ACT domain-containing protein [Fulvivirga ligni]|uniref:amino acid-binding ACT domain-containing protein n=1 Tax=Fulvivirga ligni TaxID=2904246 RepID=UPI001F24B84B|nr:amino acid-binding ACT domain-containing protein [Fulvivirga ligni]UII19863.1 amino acid-binding ACT domain-containing protein [Fulvivirga ligni]
MKDLEIELTNEPGTLALMGETLGKHHISLEGGGVFYNGDSAIAHFLVEEAEQAETVLKEVGIKVIKAHPVNILKLRQDVPGQLGMFCRKLGDADVNILTQYSDHANQLIVVTDDHDKATKISEEWMKEWW